MQDVAAHKGQQVFRQQGSHQQNKAAPAREGCTSKRNTYVIAQSVLAQSPRQVDARLA
jgi:hypothetical protein